MERKSMILQITALVRAGKLNGKTYEVPFGDMRFLVYNFEMYGVNDFCVSRRVFSERSETWEPYDVRMNGNIFTDGYLANILKAVTSDVHIDKNLFK